MNPTPFQPIHVSGLQVYANPHHALHDLHAYTRYMSARSVKRMTRSNDLPRADIKRLIKILSAPDDLAAIVKEYGNSGWLHFIEQLALQMSLVDFDIQGEYRGYSSRSPSFVDNYVLVREEIYRAFLALPPAEQEKKILEHLIAHGRNEFYESGVMGSLGGFGIYGSATGIMPMLDFAGIRTFLFNLLQTCEADVWYSTASLVAYLKANYPYFLIPEKPEPDRWGHPVTRYGNFSEGQDIWRGRESIPDDAPDGFERVEGRYIERFLESIPLTLGFVEVAYSPKEDQSTRPLMNYLQAFRVNGRFLRMMRGETRPTQVTVQPNFDVLVESEFYPARILDRLREVASASPSPPGSPVITLRLKKSLVAGALVKDPDLDPAAMLEELTGTALPPNVATELKEWTGHADQFTLYAGFALLESVEQLPQAEAFTRESITGSLRLVRSPVKLLRQLEQDGLAPVWVEHQDPEFAPVPSGARSVFPHATPGAEAGAPPSPRPVSIQREIEVTLHFPDQEVFDAFRRALAEARAPVRGNSESRTLTFPQTFAPLIEQLIADFRELYTVQIQDV